jgi:hypothetical protein
VSNKLYSRLSFVSRLLSRVHKSRGQMRRVLYPANPSVPVDIKSVAVVAQLVPPTQLSRLRCTQLDVSFLFYIWYVIFYSLHGVWLTGFLANYHGLSITPVSLHAPASDVGVEAMSFWPQSSTLSHPPPLLDARLPSWWTACGASMNGHFTSSRIAMSILTSLGSDSHP